MRVQRIITDLPVADLDAARQFWTGYLGLDEESLGLDWVTRFISPDGAQVQVVTQDAAAPVVPIISVAVDDVDAAYQEALRRGYEIVHPLTDEPWGVRRFFVRDQAGNVVNILRHRA